MDLIEKSKKILSKIDDYKNMNTNDLKEIKTRIEILNNKEYEVTTLLMDELFEKKKNIIKQFKTNIKRLQKYINLNNENKFLENKKYVKQCKIVLNQINKFKNLRQGFLDELKEIDKKYENEYEKDIFNFKTYLKEKKIKDTRKKEEDSKKKKRMKTIILNIKNKVNDSSLDKENEEELKKDLKKLKESKVSFGEIKLNKETSINEVIGNSTEFRKDKKRKRATKLITNLINSQNVNQKNTTSRMAKRKETKKILFNKTWIGENFQINEKLYIENSKEIKYLEGIQNWTFYLNCIRFPLYNTYLVKAVVKIVDENFDPLSLKEYSALCEFNSEQKEPKFNLKINYNMEDIPCDNIYFIVTFVSFYEINKIIFNSPIIWGFSIFHINKFNDINEVKEGHFQIPIYLPCYLKAKQKDLKKLYLDNKLERLNICSFLISNFPTNKDLKNIKYSSGEYNNIDFNPTKFEVALMTDVNKKDSVNLKSVKYSLLSVKNLSDKEGNNFSSESSFNEQIDLFLQIGNSTVIDYTQCFEILENSFSIDIGVRALINPHKQFSYKIKATYISLDFKENIKKEKRFFKNTSENSFDNFIVFKENFSTFRDIDNNTDIIVFKIYYQFFDEDGKQIIQDYGYSVLPIFYNECVNLNGDFLLPIIINKIDNSTLKMIFRLSPFAFCNDLANGFVYEFCNLRKSGLLVTIKDNGIKLQNDYDHIDFYKINHMFMPTKLSNLYENTKTIYERNFTKKKEKKKIIIE